MRALADRARLILFLKALGESIRAPVRLYLVGGSVLVDLGLRETTLDVDYVAASDRPEGLGEVERALPRLKDELNINVEPASPGDFMPVPAGAFTRARFVGSYGLLSVYHYDYPTLVLAKIARSTERDLSDVELLLREGVASWAEVEHAWAEIRERETGWLRHTPAQVEKRFEAARSRLRLAGVTPETDL